MKKCIAIFGTSGFAREVADICHALGYVKIIFLSAGGENQDDKSNGFEIKSESIASSLAADGFEFALGIGDPRIKKKIVSRFPQFKYPNLCHPSVTFGVNQLSLIEISKGNILAAGVRLTNNIKIGNFNTINLNCTVGHDCVLADYSTLSPGANISGNVIISEGAYIGTNVSVIQGSTIRPIDIGSYSVVGAGSFVKKSVDAGTTVFGAPARTIKN